MMYRRPGMLSVKELADELNVSLDLVQSLIRQGQLPEAVRVGRIYRVPRAALERLRVGGPLRCPGCGASYAEAESHRVEGENR